MSYPNPLAWYRARRSWREDVSASLKRLETRMSNFSDAVAALTAAEKSESEELVLVLKTHAEEHQALLDAIANSGASETDLAGIKAVADQAATNLKAMQDALATTLPTPT